MGQSISPPAAALTTRGKVRKVIPSPCDPMPVAEAGQQRAGDPPSSSAVRPGRLGGRQRCQRPGSPEKSSAPACALLLNIHHKG